MRRRFWTIFLPELVLERFLKPCDFARFLFFG
jgi:hypothetical protein